MEKKRNWKKLSLMVLLVLVLLVGIAAGAGYYVFRTSIYDVTNYVKKDKSEGEEETDPYEYDDTGTYNILGIGVDRRDESWEGNSDVMMLVTINHDKKTIYLTSFLRDLYADIPGIGVRKLNAACANGGPELCVDTIVKNYQVEIDNYAMVDFNAMIDIVDALGGIDMEIDKDERVIANDYVFCMCETNEENYEDHIIPEFEGERAEVHLDGYQAVGYARNRYSGGKADFGRTERQRKVLMTIFEKAQEGGLGSMTKAVKSVLPYVTHDVDQMTMLSLIPQVTHWLSYDIQEISIPFEGEYRSENEILVPKDMEGTIKKLRDTIYGTDAD